MEAAARALIDERLRDILDASERAEARDWQRQQAEATLEKIRAGAPSEASEEQIEADFDRALARARARSA
jgi:hypothetical protein